MKQRKSRGSRGPLAAATACVVLLVIATIAVVVAPMAASTRSMGLALVAILGVVVAVFAQPLFADWLGRRQFSESNEADVRALVTSARSVGPTSQLGSMIALRQVISMRLRSIDFTYGADELPRLEVGGLSTSTDQLAINWVNSPNRLIILGEAGYGKTTAALAIMHAANQNAEDSAPVVEMFALNEWYQHHLEHPGDSLSEWMAAELFRAYGLTISNARALVLSAKLIPVLDGFDEIPMTGAIECIEAITAYSGKSTFPRPFALTCRVDRYRVLASKWLTFDQQVVILGLDLEQVTQVIISEKRNAQNWARAIEMLSAPDGRLARLFASPLRLSIALQTYDEGDPTELAAMSEAAAKERLWERLLTDPRWSFEGAGADVIGCWLAWLARSMDSMSRQFFGRMNSTSMPPIGRKRLRDLGCDWG